MHLICWESKARREISGHRKDFFPLTSYCNAGSLRWQKKQKKNTKFDLIRQIFFKFAFFDNKPLCKSRCFEIFAAFFHLRRHLFEPTCWHWQSDWLCQVSTQLKGQAPLNKVCILSDNRAEYVKKETKVLTPPCLNPDFTLHFLQIHLQVFQFQIGKLIFFNIMYNARYNNIIITLSKPTSF